MDIVRLMYKYINKFINSHELLGALKDLNLSLYSKEEVRDVKELIKNIEFNVENIPNEVDQFEKKRLEKIDFMKESFEKILSDSKIDAKGKDLIVRQMKNLEEDKCQRRDGGKLYETIFSLLTRNDTINKYAKNMSDFELLEFIAEYISVPFPPPLEQDGFDALVDVGISHDKREWLWRLCVNYNSKNIDFSRAAEYFIRVRDGYYIQELLCACSQSVNKMDVLKSVVETNDKKVCY